MKKNLLSKILTLCIVVLFIGVSYTSATSVDTKSALSNNQSEECRDCNEVSDADLISVERLLDKVEVYSKLLLVLSRYNPEIREKCEGLLESIPFGNFRDFPIICSILEPIWNRYYNLSLKLMDLLLEYENNTIIHNILGFIFVSLEIYGTYLWHIGLLINCDW
jgi:hypothetical protein